MDFPSWDIVDFIIAGISFVVVYHFFRPSSVSGAPSFRPFCGIVLVIGFAIIMISIGAAITLLFLSLIILVLGLAGWDTDIVRQWIGSGIVGTVIASISGIVTGIVIGLIRVLFSFMTATVKDMWRS